MQNALAVYGPKTAISGSKLTDLAAASDIAVRFMAMGGYIPSNPAEIQKKSLASVNGGGLLLVGGFASDAPALAKFDQLIQLGDRLPIAELLNGGQLPWCELLTKSFNYEKEIGASPKLKEKIDGSVTKDQLVAVKQAKSRYILYNQSRKKNGGQLMKALAAALAEATGGVVADYKHPGR